MSGHYAVTFKDAKTDLFTHKVDDETFEGSWARARDHMIVFADHNRDGNTFSFHGGAIAGAPEGHPVQLIFWGSWWNTADGSARRALFEQRTQALLGTRYFTELGQYGIPHAPTWRGSTTVVRPAPPGATNPSGAMRATLDLIDDLLDDGVFPDPDDAARFVFLVLMPPGFTTGGANGAHWHDYDGDGPFDTDEYWAGWVRYFDPAVEDVENTMRTLTHELVEILTDPEGDGWRTEVDSGTNELCDAAESPAPGMTPPTTSATKQTAIVGGARVCGYWSNAHGAPIIPVDGRYIARLTASVEEVSRRLIESGTFRPDPHERLGGCIEDRDFAWRTYRVHERVRVSIAQEGFHAPGVEWTLNGQRVAGTSSVVLRLPVDGFSGRDPMTRDAEVRIAFTANASSLSLDIPSADGSFDLTVGCVISEGSLTGNVRSRPVARPDVLIGIHGVQLELDPDYTRELKHCLEAFKRDYVQQVRPNLRPKPGDPPFYRPGMLTGVLPAYTPIAEYEQARDVARGIRAAIELLAPDDARQYAQALVQSVPSLATRVPREALDQQLTTLNRLREQTQTLR